MSKFAVIVNGRDGYSVDDVDSHTEAIRKVIADYEKRRMIITDIKVYVLLDIK